MWTYRWMRQCRNAPVVQRDGKWYCKIHDPEGDAWFRHWTDYKRTLKKGVEKELKVDL